MIGVGAVQARSGCAARTTKGPTALFHRLKCPRPRRGRCEQAAQSPRTSNPPTTRWLRLSPTQACQCRFPPCIPGVQHSAPFLLHIPPQSVFGHMATLSTAPFTSFPPTFPASSASHTPLRPPRLLIPLAATPRVTAKTPQIYDAGAMGQGQHGAHVGAGVKRWLTCEGCGSGSVSARPWLPPHCRARHGTSILPSARARCHQNQRHAPRQSLHLTLTQISSAWLEAPSSSSPKPHGPC